MATKKQSQEFLTRMNKAIEELGGVKTEKNNYILDTIAGELEIHVSEDSQYCFTVFCKFKDVARAKEKFNCNPYSGKYNIHIGATKEMTVEKAIEICTMLLEASLPTTA